MPATIELTATEDSGYILSVPSGTFSFGSGETVTYQWHSGTFPPFLSFVPSSHTLVGKPLNEDVGEFTFEISATVDDVTYEYATVHLTVINTNDAPILKFGGIADKGVDVGDTFTFNDTFLYFGDVDKGDTLTFTATRANGTALPSWLHFDATTGVFSGTPARANAGTVSVKVTATDTGGLSKSDIFNVTVSAPPNSAPTRSPTAVLPDGKEDTDYTVAFAALLKGFTDVDGDELSIINLDTTQDGRSLDVTTDAKKAKISLEPNSYGDITLTYTVSDGHGGTIDASRTISVESVDDPTVLNVRVGAKVATEDKKFSFELPTRMFSDPDGSYTIHAQAHAIIDGEVSSLPSWLHFRGIGAGGGKFQGTPTNEDVGKVEIVVSAGGVSDTFFINVKNANDAPEIELDQKDSRISDDVKKGDVVATFDVTDQDARDKVSITVSDNIPGKVDAFAIKKIDIDTFSLVTTVLTSGVIESYKTVSLVLTAKDSHGLLDTSKFSIKVDHSDHRAESILSHGEEYAPHHDWSM